MGEGRVRGVFVIKINPKYKLSLIVKIIYGNLLLTTKTILWINNY